MNAPIFNLPIPGYNTGKNSEETKEYPMWKDKCDFCKANIGDVYIYRGGVLQHIFCKDCFLEYTQSTESAKYALIPIPSIRVDNKVLTIEQYEWSVYFRHVDRARQEKDFVPDRSIYLYGHLVPTK